MAAPAGGASTPMPTNTDVYCLKNAGHNFDGPAALHMLGSVELIMGQHLSSALSHLTDSIHFRTLLSKAAGGEPRFMRPSPEAAAKAVNAEGEFFAPIHVGKIDEQNIVVINAPFVASPAPSRPASGASRGSAGSGGAGGGIAMGQEAKPCTYCGIIGHYANHCKKKQADQAARASAAGNGGGGGGGGAGAGSGASGGFSAFFK